MEMYRYDIDALRARKAELEQEIGEGPSLIQKMAQSTYQRVKLDKLSYLEFGPYWWAVKRILKVNGIDLGNEDNQYLANDYALPDPELTMIAAWDCADYNRATYFRGTREFAVDDDGENVITLFDKDMEEQQ